MGEPVQFKELLASIRQALECLPEHRRGKNTSYSLTEAGLSAFAVFYLQSPSFLAHQRDMQRQRGRNNAQSLFGAAQIPSDSQLLNLLNPVDPAGLRSPFWEFYAQLKATGHLDAYIGVEGTYLLSFDGSQYFGSEKVQCPNCRVTLREGQPHYSHGVLLAVLGAPSRKL